MTVVRFDVCFGPLEQSKRYSVHIEVKLIYGYRPALPLFTVSWYFWLMAFQGRAVFFFFWEIPTGWQTFTFTLLLGKVGNAMAGGFYHHVCHVDTMDGCIGLPSVIGLPPLLMSLCFLLEGQKRRRKNPSPVSLESLEAFQEILFLLYGVYAVTTS